MNLEALVQFLKSLEANNHKLWFDENRARYEALRRDFYADLGTIIDGFAAFDPLLSKLDPKSCGFRINKRFPNEQGPYKTTFSAAFSEQGRKVAAPSYYLEVDQDGAVTVGGGLYMPSKEPLNAIRHTIADHPDRLRAAAAGEAFKRLFGQLDDERAKKVPPGFSADHPAIDLIKLKSFTAITAVDVSQVDDLPAFALEHFRALQPLVAFLREAPVLIAE